MKMKHDLVLLNIGVYTAFPDVTLHILESRGGTLETIGLVGKEINMVR